MIYDVKENLLKYRGISKNLDGALDYLSHANFSLIGAGKYPVQRDKIYTLVQTPETCQRADALWESHRRYIDIQYLLCGTEQIGFQNVNALTVKEKYDDQKDIAFYKENYEGFFIKLKPDSFVICFPDDAHMPLICTDGPQSIKKVVIKVKVE